MKMQTWLGALLLAAICAGAELRASTNKIPVINIKKVPLLPVVENLAQQADLNFMIDPHWLDGFHATNSNWYDGPFVTFTWTNISAGDALARLLKEHGLFVTTNSQTGVTRITSTNAASRVFDQGFIGSTTNEAIPLIQFMNTSLEVSLNNLAKQGRFEVEIVSANFSSSETIAVRWVNLTARQAIAAVCENYDLQITKGSGTNVWSISRRQANTTKPAR